MKPNKLIVACAAAVVVSSFGIAENANGTAYEGEFVNGALQ